MTGWRDRAARALVDPTCHQGHPIAESTDRRWLWQLAWRLSGDATTDVQRQSCRDLEGYLAETCEHHYHTHSGDGVIAAHQQCLWCCDTEFLDEQPS